MTVREVRRGLRALAALYGRRVDRLGPCPEAVLWSCPDNQRRRFVLLAGIIAPEARAVSINDVGCGYGALFEFLARHPALEGGRYRGYDVCPEMVRAARTRIPDRRARFVVAPGADRDADYAFVSGTFNINPGLSKAAWRDYVQESLAALWARTRRGLAFNMLDAARPVFDPPLYHADALEFFEFCTRELSANVTLMPTRPLPDWTIWVRRGND